MVSNGEDTAYNHGFSCKGSGNGSYTNDMAQVLVDSSSLKDLQSLAF